MYRSPVFFLFVLPTEAPSLRTLYVVDFCNKTQNSLGVSSAVYRPWIIVQLEVFPWVRSLTLANINRTTVLPNRILKKIIPCAIPSDLDGSIKFKDVIHSCNLHNKLQNCPGFPDSNYYSFIKHVDYPTLRDWVCPLFLLLSSVVYLPVSLRRDKNKTLVDMVITI